MNFATSHLYGNGFIPFQTVELQGFIKRKHRRCDKHKESSHSQKQQAINKDMAGIIIYKGDAVICGDHKKRDSTVGHTLYTKAYDEIWTFGASIQFVPFPRALLCCAKVIPS